MSGPSSDFNIAESSSLDGLLPQHMRASTSIEYPIAVYKSAKYLDASDHLRRLVHICLFSIKCATRMQD